MAIGVLKHYPILSMAGSCKVASLYIHADCSDQLMQEFFNSNGKLSDDKFKKLLLECGVSDDLSEKVKLSNALAEMSHILGIKTNYRGLSYDYTYKKEIAYNHFYLPNYAPERFLNIKDNRIQRQSFWSEVDERETKMGHIADAFIFSLPNEFYNLRLEEQHKLEKCICDEIANIFISRGHAVDIAVHHKEISNITYKVRKPLYDKNGSPIYTKTGKQKYKCDYEYRYDLRYEGWYDLKNERYLSKDEVNSLNNYHIHANVCNRGFCKETRDWSNKSQNIQLKVAEDILIPIAKKTKSVERLCRAYEDYFEGKVKVIQSDIFPTKLRFYACEPEVIGQRIPLIDGNTYVQKVRAGNRKEWQREKIDVADYMNQKSLVSDLKLTWNNILNPYIDKVNQIYMMNINHIDCRAYKERKKDYIQSIELEDYRTKIPIPRVSEKNQDVISKVKDLNKDIDELNEQVSRVNSLRSEIALLMQKVKSKIMIMLSFYSRCITEDLISRINSFHVGHEILDKINVSKILNFSNELHKEEDMKKALIPRDKIFRTVSETQHLEENKSLHRVR